MEESDTTSNPTEHTKWKAYVPQRQTLAHRRNRSSLTSQTTLALRPAPDYDNSGRRVNSATSNTLQTSSHSRIASSGSEQYGLGYSDRSQYPSVDGHPRKKRLSGQMSNPVDVDDDAFATHDGIQDKAEDGEHEEDYDDDEQEDQVYDSQHELP